MTTKKQRREQVAAKRAEYDAETKRMGLEAQRIDREKRQNRLHDIERAERKKATALKMRQAHEAAEAKKEVVPSNLLSSMEYVEVGAEEKY